MEIIKPTFTLLLAAVDLNVLSELLILAVGAIIAVVLLRKIRLPVIAGMLLAGALIGPGGFHLVPHSEHLALFGEIGVALLLFTIGLEFNRDRISATGPRAVVAGVFQIILTLLAATGLGMALGLSLIQSCYIGMVVSLSSTAIVLRGLTDRAELSAPHGRLILGTLIVQDLAIVPMLIIVPLIGGKPGGALISLGVVVLKAGLLIGLAVLVARFILPWLMREVSAVGSRDVFLLAALTMALGMSWLTYVAGLSPALGAFIAGIMLADSEYAHHTLSEVLPVRELFFSFFFITMGMLFDWRLLLSAPLAVAAVLFLLLAGKGLIAALAVLILRFPARIAILFGLGLAQFGEFGYLLLQAGKSPPLAEPLLGPPASEILLCAGLLSMFLTPLILALAPHMTAGEKLLRPLEKLLRVRGIDEPEERHLRMSGHILIAGMGPVGRMLMAELKELGSEYIVLEMNSRTVHDCRSKGEPVYYGDVTSREALEHACIPNAEAVVVTFNDRAAVLRAVNTIRGIAPDVKVVARAQFASQAKLLMEAGATYVVVDELASGEALVGRVAACLDGLDPGVVEA